MVSYAHLCTKCGASAKESRSSHIRMCIIGQDSRIHPYMKSYVNACQSLHVVSSVTSCTKSLYVCIDHCMCVNSCVNACMNSCMTAYISMCIYIKKTIDELESEIVYHFVHEFMNLHINAYTQAPERIPKQTMHAMPLRRQHFGFKQNVLKAFEFSAR